MGEKGLERVIRRSQLSAEAREEIMRSLWRQYYAKLTVFVSCGTGSYPATTREDSEDAVQEIMVKILSSLERYDPRYSLNTWVYAIARNHLRDSLRKQRVRLRRTGSMSNEEPVSNYHGPEELVVRREEEQIAADYIEGLSNSERQIAYLRFEERMTYSEIGRVLDAPTGTVKYRVHEIRKGLRDALEKDFPVR